MTYIVVAISCDIRVGLVQDLLGRVVDQVIPDGLALPICIPAALNLVRRRSHAPHEVRGKSAHVGCVLGGSVSREQRVSGCGAAA